MSIIASLWKFDHVSRANFNWLTVSSLIKYRCLCGLRKIYMGDGTVLDPPVVFETNHKHHTRSSQSQPSVDCPLLRHSATLWWNNLSGEVALSSTFPY